MTRQLNIRSDEAADTARRLAAQLGLSQTEVVVEALRRMSEQVMAPSTLVTPERARADLAKLRRMIAEASRGNPANVTSDHRDMYDEWGLPI